MNQYVIIAKDARDTEALERRLATRSAHLRGASVLKKENHFLIGGAMLNEEGEMMGSVMIVQFENDDAFKAWYAQEPYIVNEVWKDIEIYPFKVAQVE